MTARRPYAAHSHHASQLFRCQARYVFEIDTRVVTDCLKPGYFLNRS